MPTPLVINCISYFTGAVQLKFNLPMIEPTSHYTAVAYSGFNYVVKKAAMNLTSLATLTLLNCFGGNCSKGNIGTNAAGWPKYLSDTQQSAAFISAFIPAHIIAVVVAKRLCDTSRMPITYKQIALLGAVHFANMYTLSHFVPFPNDFSYI